MKHSGTWWLSISGVILIAGGTIGFSHLFKTTGPNSSSYDPPLIVKPIRKNLIEEVIGSGTVASRQIHQCVMPFTGKIKKWHVQEYMHVSQHMPLVLLDTGDLKKELEKNK